MIPRIKEFPRYRDDVPADRMKCYIDHGYQSHLILVKTLSMISVIIILSLLMSCSSNPPEESTPKVETRQDIIEKSFSAWDGSHRNLERYVKDHMKNPESYKHVDTRYVDNGDHLLIYTKFRGTNSYGGVVTNIVKAKVSLNGEVIHVFDE